MPREKRRPAGSISSEVRVEGGGLLRSEGFVGGGAVEAGDRDVVEAKVDAELGDVVDHVVEEEAAEHGGAGSVGDDLGAEAEAPVLHQGFVAGVDE